MHSCTLRTPEAVTAFSFGCVPCNHTWLGEVRAGQLFGVALVLFSTSHLSVVWENAGLLSGSACWLLALSGQLVLLALLVGGVCLSLVSHSEDKGAYQLKRGGSMSPSKRCVHAGVV